MLIHLNTQEKLDEFVNDNREALIEYYLSTKEEIGNEEDYWFSYPIPAVDPQSVQDRLDLNFYVTDDTEEMSLTAYATKLTEIGTLEIDTSIYTTVFSALVHCLECEHIFHNIDTCPCCGNNDPLKTVYLQWILT